MDNKDIKKIPKHIGIIMDGNRRWARERNLPTFDGHLKGYQKVKRLPEWFFPLGVEIISVYAFSTENWQRTREEVNYLMKLLRLALSDELEELHRQECRIMISGRIDELPGDLPEICIKAIDKTKNNTNGIINFCLNYGGQAEIVDAIKKIIKQGISLEQVHEGMVKKYLYSNELPDLDMIVRTSGEKRLSGFMLWRSTYSELFFMEKYWPDFEEEDARKIIEEYGNRQRRMGGD